jgi:5'-3' exonuclease
MGINGLNKAIKDTTRNAVSLKKISDIPKGVYGVDVSVYLFPSLYNKMGKGKGSHIRKFMDMIHDWRSHGHDLVMVFDGDTTKSGLKKDTIEKRKIEKKKKEEDILELCSKISSQGDSPECEFTSPNDYANYLINTGVCSDVQVLKLEQAVKNNIEINTSDFDDLVNLFEMNDVKYIYADGEADHMLAALYRENKINGVISEDSDMLTHGVNILIKGINDFQCRREGVVRYYELDKLLEEWEITYDQFIDVCILAGCDYCTNKIKGIACKTGLRIVKKYGDVTSYLANIKGKKLEQVPETFMSDYKSAFLLFKNCDESVPQDFKTEPSYNVNKEQLLEWLCLHTNYKRDTVSKKLNIY